MPITRMALFAIVSSSLLRVCAKDPPPPAVSPVFGASSGRFVPEHGGSLAVSGGVVAEASAKPDGRLVMYVRDPRGQPLVSDSIEVSVRTPEGEVRPVPVAFDPSEGGYVGVPGSVAPGPHAVIVQVQPTPTAPPVEVVTPPVVLVAAAPLPPPRYGGRVEPIGTFAVEIVPSESGDVGMYWMDSRGTPIPPAQVVLPDVTISTNGQPQTIRPVVVEDHFVARVGAPIHASIEVGVPAVTVRGMRYRRFRVPRAVVVGPRVVAVVAPSPVLVGPVVRPGIILAPGLRIVGDDDGPGRRGRGHAYGHDRDDDDDGHGNGRGHGHGHGRGHGRH